MTTNWFHAGVECGSPRNNANPLPDDLNSRWTETPAKGRNDMSHAPHQFLQDVRGLDPDEFHEMGRNFEGRCERQAEGGCRDQRKVPCCV